MQIIFMGTAEFAVPSLDRVAKSAHRIVSVVTQPDRPKGRKRELTPSPVKNAALQAGLPIWQPERVSNPDFVKKIELSSPDLLVTCAYGQILPVGILTIPRYGCINLHASLLPLYRGAAPIHRAVIRGDTVTGVTTMYMNEGMDAGDIILQAAAPVFPQSSMGEIHDILAEMGAFLLEQTIGLVSCGKAPRRPQEMGHVSFAPALTRDDERIRWDKPGLETINLIRGMNPWPLAYTRIEDKECKILRATGYHGRTQERPGTIVGILREKGFTVAAGDGSLVLVEEILPQGKRPMPAIDYVNGYRLKPGQVLDSAEGSGLA